MFIWNSSWSKLFYFTQSPPEIIYFKNTPPPPPWESNGGPLRPKVMVTFSDLVQHAIITLYVPTRSPQRRVIVIVWQRNPWSRLPSVPNCWEFGGVFVYGLTDRPVSIGHLPTHRIISFIITLFLFRTVTGKHGKVKHGFWSMTNLLYVLESERMEPEQ